MEFSRLCVVCPMRRSSISRVVPMVAAAMTNSARERAFVPKTASGSMGGFGSRSVGRRQRYRDWRVRSKCRVWDSRHEAQLSGVYRTLEDVEWDD